jgi:organic hydroperoxide reductase OsmC/OhrA
LSAIPGSSDRHFRGDAACYNPEEMLVASVSACHMLSYLHVCAVNGVVVEAYEDDATGVMVETADGGGSITGVMLRPNVTISASSDEAKALAFHQDAHRLCFIANSVGFPIECESVITKAALP